MVKCCRGLCYLLQKSSQTCNESEYCVVTNLQDTFVNSTIRQKTSGFVDVTKVFVSYARRDARIVHPLAERLKRRGVPIWIDAFDIEVGTPWDIAIEQALREATHVLVVLSRASVISQNVLNEVDYAVENRKRIIPIRINECTVPFQLRRIQYFDFSQDYDAAIQQLLLVLPHGLNLNGTNNSTVLSSRAGLPELPVPNAGGSRVLVFPEDKVNYLQGGSYYFPTLRFHTSSNQELKAWTMKVRTIIIGRREDCDIVINSDRISRQHIHIFRADDAYYLQDLRSRNGTWINNTPVGEDPVILTHQSLINVGNLIYISFEYFVPGGNKNDPTPYY